MIQYLAIIPLLKRNTSKENIMENSIMNTENNINILTQLKNVNNFPIKPRKLKTLIWDGVSYFSEIAYIELTICPTHITIALNGNNILSAIRYDLKEMESLGLTLPEKNDSFSFEFNGEDFDSEFKQHLQLRHNWEEKSYKLVGFWIDDSYNLNELINEWLLRIFKVKQD